MHTFEHTIDVAAPVEHVFAFMTDTENWLRTHPGLVDLEILEESDETIHMDATYRMLGISNVGEMTQTVVEPDAHSRVDFESDGLRGHLDYRYSESDGVTTVVESAEYEFGDSLLERIVEPVGKRYNERQFRHALQSMKELMEAELAEADDGAIAA